MPTVPTTVFEGKAKYSTYDDAVGVTSSMLKISCPKEVYGVKLSLITNDKITGNDKAIASSNDTVGYYLYLGDNSDVLDVSAPFNIESYKTAEGQYAIPFKAKYLKLTDNSVQSGDVLSSGYACGAGLINKIVSFSRVINMAAIPMAAFLI